MHRGDASPQLIHDALLLLQNAGALVTRSAAKAIPTALAAETCGKTYIGNAEFQEFAEATDIDPRKMPEHKTSARATAAYNSALTLGWRQYWNEGVASWIPELQFDPPFDPSWKKVADIKEAEPRVSVISLHAAATAINERLGDRVKSHVHKYAGPKIERRSIKFWLRISEHYLDKSS